MKTSTKILMVAAMLTLPSLGACDYNLTGLPPILETRDDYSASHLQSEAEPDALVPLGEGGTGA